MRRAHTTSFASIGLVSLLTLLSGCYQSGQVLGTEDAGRGPGDGGTDSGSARDGGVSPDECAPPDIRLDRCGGCVSLVPYFYWDGRQCVEACEACDGAGCGDVYSDLTACRAAHASCGPALCASTGGTWEDVPLQCPIGRCGYRDPSSLGVCDPGPSCNCGPGRSFDPERGCEDDPSCTIGELCLASGGHPTNCAAHAVCGTTTADCTELSGADGATACNCGPAMRFDVESGCVPDDSCGANDASVCEFSGHEMSALCAPTRCGIPSELACAAPACLCDDHEVFDRYRGCVWSAECRVRDLGQSCGDDGVCADGAACCGGTCAPACYPACGSSCDGSTGCTFECRPERVEHIPAGGSLEVGQLCDEVVVCVGGDGDPSPIEAISSDFECDWAIEGDLCFGMVCTYRPSTLDSSELATICAVTMLEPPPDRIACVVHL